MKTPKVPELVAAARQPYSDLCERVASAGGRVRLLREGRGLGLVVDVPDTSGEQIRAAGFTFTDVVELDAHALLLLDWLKAVAE